MRTLWRAAFVREGWGSESQWVVGSIRDQGDMRAERKSDEGAKGISRLAENTAARGVE